MSNDQFIQQELSKVLRPNEKLELSAMMVDAPPFWLYVLVLGPLFSWLVSKYYFVALTSERLILIRTRMGFVGIRQSNLGVTGYERAAITKVSTGGIMNYRSMKFHGPNLSLMISPWTKPVATQSRFFKDVPKLVPASIGTAKAA